MKAKQIIEAAIVSQGPSFLEQLDALIGPPNAIDDRVFNALFDAYMEGYAESLAPEDEEEAEAFFDSTLKHQVFDYGPGCRPEFLKAGKNDLATVLVDMAEGDQETMVDARLPSSYSMELTAQQIVDKLLNEDERECRGCGRKYSEGEGEGDYCSTRCKDKIHRKA
jgi:hypothetical protein